MPVTPSGPLSIPLLGLARLVASSSAFRSVVGAADESAALAFVHLNEVSDPSSQRPLAIVSNDQATQFEMDRVGNCSGSLILSFEFNENEAYESDGERLTDFANTVGAILSEMFVKAATPDGQGNVYFNLLSVRQEIPPSFADYQTEDREPGDDRFIGCAFEVFWS